MREPTIGGLCEGYGGLTAAAQAVFGGRVAWHAETDPGASRILAWHRPGVPNHGDITTADWAAVEPVGILTAGWPCQPWSHAGVGRGVDDPRDLWPAVARAVRDLRPRLVVMENVPGFAADRYGLGRTADDLAALGYGLRWTRVRASDAGAPHLRERWFGLAWDEHAADAASAERQRPELADLAAAGG
jgi:DNA (cytosine-5)-methyltransferase 1